MLKDERKNDWKSVCISMVFVLMCLTVVKTVSRGNLSCTYFSAVTASPMLVSSRGHELLVPTDDVWLCTGNLIGSISLWVDIENDSQYPLCSNHHTGSLSAGGVGGNIVSFWLAPCVIWKLLTWLHFFCEFWSLAITPTGQKIAS